MHSHPTHKLPYCQNIAFLLFLLFLAIPALNAQAPELPEKARAFLQSLSPELRARTQFALDAEERFQFNFVPMDRKGPTFHDFNQAQKTAALALLRASLSEQGYQKTIEIMELERVLMLIEQQAPESRYRDPLNYHFCIFGTPAAGQAWGWSFEGHHISLNFVIDRNQLISSTPSFFGSNPGIVQIDFQRGKQVLKLETELGFLLVNALSEEQLKIARFSEQAPREIVTGNRRKVRQLEPKGIAFTEMTEAQQKLFLQLLEVYVRNYQLGFSEELMQKIKRAGIEKLHFAWAGSLQAGRGHYYRIQGPMLLIEYDNTQNNANHVHTIVRDLTNDFAEDLLREHYRAAHE